MEGHLIILIAFFIPGILTIVDFVFFVLKGEKRFDHFGGLALDGIHLLGFPLLYTLFFSYAGGSDFTLFQEPYSSLSIPIIALSVIGYFIVRYAYPFLSDSWTTIILILLTCGLFINVSMIYEHLSLFSFFNISIILLYIMQIVTHSHRLLKTTYDRN
jgi:hypothetical protein